MTNQTLEGEEIPKIDKGRFFRWAKFYYRVFRLIIYHVAPSLARKTTRLKGIIPGKMVYSVVRITHQPIKSGFFARFRRNEKYV